MKQPNAAQKRFIDHVCLFIERYTLGYLYPGYEQYFGYHVHHPCGRSAKHNKVEIGHWFILPVPVELHDVSSNHPLNVTHYKHRFTETFGAQACLFRRLVEGMRIMGLSIPPDGVLNEIFDSGE